MEFQVDQERALRRAGRTLWWIPLVSFWPAFSIGRKTLTIEAVILVAVIVVGLLVFVAWASRRRRAAWLKATWAPIEMRMSAPDPDRFYAATQRHLARWWFVYLFDRRHTASSYGGPLWKDAPLRLPLEFSVEGSEVVLRGSAVHVRAAAKYGARWLRSSQAKAPSGLAS